MNSRPQSWNWLPACSAHTPYVRASERTLHCLPEENLQPAASVRLHSCWRGCRKAQCSAPPAHRRLWHNRCCRAHPGVVLRADRLLHSAGRSRGGAPHSTEEVPARQRCLPCTAGRSHGAHRCFGASPPASVQVRCTGGADSRVCQMRLTSPRLCVPSDACRLFPQHEVGKKFVTLNVPASSPSVCLSHQGATHSRNTASAQLLMVSYRRPPHRSTCLRRWCDLPTLSGEDLLTACRVWARCWTCRA